MLDVDGIAVPLSRRNAVAFLAALVLCLGATAAEAQRTAARGLCYASTGNADGGRLLTVDPETGAGTLVADIAGLGAVSALAIDSKGRIFATDVTQPTNVFNTPLYRIDAVSGAATLIGATGIQGLDGLAFDANDVLFGAETAALDRIYRIDPTTAAATFIGNMGVQGQVTGLAFDPTDGTLYGSVSGPLATSPDQDQIVRIDTSTGAATAVGVTGLGGSTPGIFFFGAKLFGSKGGGGGTPGGVGPPNNLIAIDKQTGAGTVIGPIGFTAVSGLDCYLPPLASEAPALGSVGLLLVMAALLLAAFVSLGRKTGVRRIVRK